MADYLAMNEFPGTGAVMQVAISFAGNRPDDNSGTTPYFDPADVKGEIVTPPTSTTVEVIEPIVLTQVNATTFKTDRIVPVGKVLRLHRSTLISYPMVDFVDRQIVTENDLDVSSRQVLYAAMEALDQSNLAIRYARQSLSFAAAATVTANNATATANAATQVANGAATAASGAVSSAAAAVKTANEAKAAANTAQTAAQAAEQHATNVETLAAQADAASAAALVAAQSAKATAEGIDAKATAAQQQAGTAVQTANQAKATAEGIDAKATQAIQTANGASTNAASAKTTAEAIESKAISAQETANAANGTANNAIDVATQAKTTADGLASSVSKAQSDATKAINDASTANGNANGRVAKTGDTMTGELSGTSFRAGTMTFSNSALRNSNSSVTLTLNSQAVKTAGATNFEMQPGDNNTAQFLVYKADGSIRGNIWNSTSGQWGIRVGNGTEHVLNSDGSVYWKTNYVYKRDAGGTDRQLVSEGRNIISSGPELASGIVPSIAAANGNHYAGCSLKITNAGNSSAAAVIAFHREGSHAMYFGLNTDNELAYGGYSYGGVAYRIWSERNFNPNEYVRYDRLRQELGGRNLNEVGTIVFCQTVDGNTRGPGDTIGAGGLRYGSSNSALSYGPDAGTFRCLGYGNNGGVCAWLRIN